MNHRELARDYYKKCGITYKNIKMIDVYKLIQLLNKNIALANSCMIMINVPKLTGSSKNIYFKNDELIFAEIRVKGTYFNDREAVTFYEDGYIGLCGWADNNNSIPIIIAFKEWCDYMKNKENDGEAGVE